MCRVPSCSGGPRWRCAEQSPKPVEPVQPLLRTRPVPCIQLGGRGGGLRTARRRHAGALDDRAQHVPMCAVPSYKRASAVEEYGARADTMLEADADDGGWVAPAHDPESSAARAEDVSSVPAAGGAAALQPGRHGLQPAQASQRSACRLLCGRIQPARHRIIPARAHVCALCRPGTKFLLFWLNAALTGILVFWLLQRSAYSKTGTSDTNGSV